MQYVVLAILSLAFILAFEAHAAISAPKLASVAQSKKKHQAILIENPSSRVQNHSKKSFKQIIYQSIYIRVYFGQIFGDFELKIPPKGTKMD